MKQLILINLAAGLIASHGLAQNREMILPVPQFGLFASGKIKGGTLLFLSGVGPAEGRACRTG